MSVSLAEIASIVAVVVTFYGIYAQRTYRRSQESINFTQSDSVNLSDALKMKEEYKAENRTLKEDIASLRLTIEAMQNREEKREAAMNALQAQFDRDALLRANVEKALELSNAKISELTQRVSALEDELDQARQLLADKDRIIAELKSNSGTFSAARPGGLLK
jgi:chromosome segregation ATPase